MGQGLIISGLKKYKEAAEEFSTAIRLAPDDDDARYVLALVYVQHNDFKKATEQYEKLLEKNIPLLSKNIQLRRILSQLYFFDGNYASAEKHCKQISQVNPVYKEAEKY